jgi:hypothetical protein
LLHKKEVDRALDLFAISKPTRKKIAARYRELAFNSTQIKTVAMKK